MFHLYCQRRSHTSIVGLHENRDCYCNPAGVVRLLGPVTITQAISQRLRLGSRAKASVWFC